MSSVTGTLLQAHVHQHLVVGALQERGVDRDVGAHAADPARPSAIVNGVLSAMPTSKKRSAWRSLRSQPGAMGIAAVNGQAMFAVAIFVSSAAIARPFSCPPFFQMSVHHVNACTLLEQIGESSAGS
jgi:hypothetical protein